MLINWVDQQWDCNLYLKTKTKMILLLEHNELSRWKWGHTIFFALFMFVVTKLSQNLHMCSTIIKLKMTRRANLETVIFFSFLNLEGWKFLKFAVNVQVTFDDFLAEFTAILCYLELWTYIIFFENIEEQYYF